MATRAPHSSDWLSALPLTSCGLRLDDEAIRIAVGLRLGINLCKPHSCRCGANVDMRGNHGLACLYSAGRSSRHQQLNDIIFRALNRASIPCCKEPCGLETTDNKRPDGLTLVPWSRGEHLLWDVTVTDTLASSNLPFTAITAGSAAEQRASQKELKYNNLSDRYNFCPIAIETFGPICSKGLQFLNNLGHRLAVATGDSRETTFLFQRLSVTIQRYNAICILGSFPATEYVADDD